MIFVVDITDGCGLSSEARCELLSRKSKVMLYFQFITRYPSVHCSFTGYDLLASFIALINSYIHLCLFIYLIYLCISQIFVMEYNSFITSRNIIDL